MPLLGGRFDSTEVDMRIGNVLVEAKLTESVFSALKAKVSDIAIYLRSSTKAIFRSQNITTIPTS